MGFLSFLAEHGAEDPIDSIALSTGLSRLQVLSALEELELAGIIKVNIVGEEHE